MRQKHRIETLDYLRGVMALSVMLYHYVSDCGYALGSETLLGKLGVYAVSIFYILSGLSLGLVYSGRINNRGDIADFAVRRVFRIFPLFWIVVTLSLIFAWLASALKGAVFLFPWGAAVLNYSLLFGFVAPAAYLSTGAWSIGNEMVFYAIFPAVILLSSRLKYVLPVALAVSYAVAAWFAAVVLDAAHSIEAQWVVYINPFNQLFLFLSGLALATYTRPSISRGARSSCVLLGCLCVLVFCFLPAHGDSIVLVTGWRRAAMSACCIILVGCVFVANLSVRGSVGRCLAFLGEGCYSIYLLHPLVAIPVAFIVQRYRPGWLAYAYVLAALATLLASSATFKYVERPMISLGRRVSQRLRFAPALGTS